MDLFKKGELVFFINGYGHHGKMLFNVQEQLIGFPIRYALLGSDLKTKVNADHRIIKRYDSQSNKKEQKAKLLGLLKKAKSTAARKILMDKIKSL